MKQDWKPGTMIYPLPAVLVSCGKEESEYNIITVAWTGTICTNPPMCYISVRPERYSHEIIKKNMEFVINLTTKRHGLSPQTGAEYVRGAIITKFEENEADSGTLHCGQRSLVEESPLCIDAV